MQTAFSPRKQKQLSFTRRRNSHTNNVVSCTENMKHGPWQDKQSNQLSPMTPSLPMPLVPTCPHHHLGLHHPPCTECQPVHKIAARTVPSQCGRFMLIPFQKLVGQGKGLQFQVHLGLVWCKLESHSLVEISVHGVNS